MKVKALDTYKKLGVKDKGLNFIPEEGHQFEVDEDRLKVLQGDNPFKAIFVEVVNGEIEKPKKTRKKK